MSILHSRQFKIVTIWPELVNKRLQTVTIHVKESCFIKENDWWLVKGLLQRRVLYFDDHGRNRKTEDQLQFEVMVDAAGSNVELDLLNIELKQDYFIFQPRRIGENQAVFEHGFSLIIHQQNPKTIHPGDPDFLLPIYADLIIDRGQGKTVLTLPELFSGVGSALNMVNCRIDFAQEYTPPIVTGVLKGVISYLNPQKLRSEMEFEQPLSLCLNLPPLATSQRLVITGKVDDLCWWFDPASQKWGLECKLEYNWRIVRETELICIINADAGLKRYRIKTPLLYKKLTLQLPKSFILPIGEVEPSELTVSQTNLTTRLTKKGILLHLNLRIEVYTIDHTGQESYQSHPVTCEELIAEPFHRNLPVAGLPVIVAPELKIISFSRVLNHLKAEMMIGCQINLYQHHSLEITSGGMPNALIFSSISIEQKTFTLSGFQVLQLRTRPILIKELRRSPIKTDSQAKNGWIPIQGEFELKIVYLDQKHCLREDTFPIRFRGTYLWDRLQITDEVELNCRLEHDSYTVNPEEQTRFSYCFWLNLLAESLQKCDIPVTIPNTEIMASSATMSNQGIQKQETQNYRSANGNIILTPGLDLPTFELEGELTLTSGKVREIAVGRFNISWFNYRKIAEAMVVEGRLNGEIEYWDDHDYLRRESADFSFWKCFYHHIDSNCYGGWLAPRITQSKYTPVNVSDWGKGKIKVYLKLVLQQIVEEGMPQ